MKSMKLTKKMKAYLGRFGVRLFAFIVILIMYVRHRQIMTDFLTSPVMFHITPLHVLWAVFMVIMLAHIFPGIFPKRLRTMALLKSEGRNFDPVEGYSEYDLLRYVQHMNKKAWIVLLAWLSFNAVFAALYLIGIIEEGDLMMLTVFFFLSDYICIIFYCPFQSKIMKNKCCVNCRIYDWGHFMMFTPMLFIKSFFSWSLFFVSAVVLIRWEIVYANYPERFWEGSNRTLQCSHCSDRTCRIKNSIRTLSEK